MKSTYPHIKELFQKYLEGTTSEPDLNKLLHYFGLNKDTEELKNLIKAQFEKDIPSTISQQRINKIAKGVDENVLQHIYEQRRTPTLYKWMAGISAAAILIIGILFYTVQHKIETSDPIVQSEEILPGANRAILTLDNGQSIALSEDQSGIMVDDSGITYHDGTKITENTQVQYAVLSTPRKGQYQAILPDGTKVWLNAESSLRYPTAFTGNERIVELKGEAFFEVAHNTKHPFIVETSAQNLKVTGTSFNLNAYDNEPATVTTLITGSIELGRKEDKITKSIKPDQQAVLGSTKFTVTPVDVRPFIAWKSGEFRFNETPLYEVLRQIERWYDVEVDYDKIPKDIEIYAFIRRDKKLSSVLNTLEQITGLKFTLKGRRLMLME